MKTLQIRNSTAEFLIFTKQNKEKTIDFRLWAINILKQSKMKLKIHVWR